LCYDYTGHRKLNDKIIAIIYGGGRGAKRRERKRHFFEEWVSIMIDKDN